MSTSSVNNGASFPTTQVEDLPTEPQVQGSSMRQLGGTLISSVEKLQAMMLKVQNVVQMIFAELFGRLASIMASFRSFSVCIEKLEEAFCPKPVSSPDLGTSIKQILASLNGISVPLPHMPTPAAQGIS